MTEKQKENEKTGIGWSRKLWGDWSWEAAAGWRLQGKVLGKIPELLAMIHSVLSVAWFIWSQGCAVTFGVKKQS